MVIAVVPQMNACAPKTKNTGIATYGLVVRARTRWVSVSMISPILIRSPRLTCRVIQPYDRVPSSAAARRRPW